MSDGSTANKLVLPVALLSGIAPLAAGAHAGPPMLAEQGHGPASSINAIHLTAYQQRVTDSQWVEAFLALMEHQIGTTPPLSQMLGVSPALPGGQMANDQGVNAIGGFWCATWASYMVQMTYHAFGQTSPFYGGSSFGFNLPDWSIPRVLNDHNGDGTSLQQWGQETHRYHAGPDVKPHRGWLILLEFPNDSHVEVVTGVAGNRVLTIGGNTGPNLNVARDSWTEGNPAIVGYVDPTPHQGMVSVPVRAPQAAPAAQGALAIPGATALVQETGDLAIPGLAATPVPAAYAPAPALNVPAPRLAHPAHAAPAAPGSRFAPSVTRPVGVTAEQWRWLLKFLPYALAAQAKYHISVAQQFAQLINEGGWLNYSKLASAPYYNPFGIKALPGYGTVTMPTREQRADGSWYTYNAVFARFDSYKQAFEAHAYMFVDPSGYYTQYLHLIQGKALTPDVVDAYVRAMARTYATSHTYGDDLIALIKRLDLYRFDTAQEAPPQPAASASTAPSQPASPPVSPPDSPSASPSASPSGSVVVPPPDLPATQQGGDGSVPIPGVSDTAGPGLTIPPPAIPDGAQPSATPSATQAAPSASPASTADVVGAVRVKATLSVFDHHLVLPPHVGQSLLKRGSSLRAREQEYKAVAQAVGIADWRLVAALDWVNARGNPKASPFREGEQLANSGFYSREEALLAAGMRLRKTAEMVYGLRLGDPVVLTVEELAQAYAAYRWGSVLSDAPRPVTALAFPYATKGLSSGLLNLEWPQVDGAPEGDTGKYNAPHGALVVVYHLGYPAIM